MRGLSRKAFARRRPFGRRRAREHRAAARRRWKKNIYIYICMEDNLRRTHPKTCKYSEGLETRISLNFPPNNPTGQVFSATPFANSRSPTTWKSLRRPQKDGRATQAKGKQIESQSLWYNTLPAAGGLVGAAFEVLRAPMNGCLEHVLVRVTVAVFAPMDGEFSGSHRVCSRSSTRSNLRTF